MEGVILIVLDLNGVLLESTHKRKEGYRYDFRARHKYVYFRPGMFRFLKFLKDHPMIRVAVWTSCIGVNADAIVNRVFSDIPLEFRYSREQCEEVPGPGFGTIKDLTRVWKEFPSWNETNTIMIDDSEEKITRQPDNLLRVSEFIVERHLNDTVLFQVEKNLESLLS